jgi:hypothetical protein
VCRSLALLLALALAGAARADDGAWEARGEVGGGVDTNPGRLAGPGAVAAGFTSALVEARAGVEGEGRRASVRIAEAGRLYLRAPRANALGSRLEADVRLGLGAGFGAGASLAGSDLRERGGVLDQGTFRGEATLAWEGERWAASGGAAWSLFAPRWAEFRPFASQGPELAARLSHSPSGGHAVALGATLRSSDYGAWPGGRRDRAAGGSAEWAYRGPFVVSARYDLTGNRSTFDGGDFQRHRVALAAAAYLSGDSSLAVRVRLQRSRYPRALQLQEQLLLEGGEGQDAVEARLVLPVRGGWELALSLARHWSEVVRGGPSFDRTVAALTLGFRHGASFTMGTP